MGYVSTLSVQGMQNNFRKDFVNKLTEYQIMFFKAKYQ